MKYVSLFSGIGGFELALQSVPSSPELLCEVDDLAASVLRQRFPSVPIHSDIRTLKTLPDCDLLVAGWPCQDLSQAGRTAGISGTQSGLIEEVFRLIDQSPNPPPTILLENVAFALSLQKGQAIRHVTAALQERGYRWAFRVFDTRYFGLPQRRRRVFVCASKIVDPSEILFEVTKNERIPLPEDNPSHVGFYWTEGNTGIGWSPNSVPPLKGGSSFSIPSPPAIWDVEKRNFYAPNINDAERLQGFPIDWTLVDDETVDQRKRWKLVGNAVSVPVVQWIAQRLANPGHSDHQNPVSNASRRAINAGAGGPNRDTLYWSGVSESSNAYKPITLKDFGVTARTSMSHRAVVGFYNRYRRSKLRKNVRFLEDLEIFCQSVTK